MKFSPTPLDDDETMVHFEIESLDGKSIQFSVPKVDYRTLPTNKKLREYATKNINTINSDDLFIYMVSLYSKAGAQFLKTAEIQGGQLDAMMEHYRKESATEEGESSTSSES